MKIIVDIPVEITEDKDLGLCGRIECKRSDGLKAYPQGETMEKFNIQATEMFQDYIDSLFEED